VRLLSRNSAITGNAVSTPTDRDPQPSSARFERSGFECSVGARGRDREQAEAQQDHLRLLMMRDVDRGVAAADSTQAVTTR